LLAGLVLAGCQRERPEPPIGTAYVASNSVNLRDRLGATQINVATVRSGEKLEILERRRRWVRVRTSGGQQGWVDERHLATQELVQKFLDLRAALEGKPTHGKARARREVNLHLEPARNSPRYYQLAEEEACEVVARAARERPPRPGSKDTGKQMEDWYLLRAGLKAGWALAQFVDMAVPDEVLQYAEGKRVVAWFILGPGPEVKTEEGVERKPMILWAVVSRQGLPYDFEGLRVFAWGPRRKRYETTFIESNLKGYFPIVVENGSFTVVTENRQGQRISRSFTRDGNRVRRTGGAS
jgi:hypothetical protein